MVTPGLPSTLDPPRVTTDESFTLEIYAIQDRAAVLSAKSYSGVLRGLELVDLSAPLFHKSFSRSLISLSPLYALSWSLSLSLVVSLSRLSTSVCEGGGVYHWSCLC